MIFEILIRKLFSQQFIKSILLPILLFITIKLKNKLYFYGKKQVEFSVRG